MELFYENNAGRMMISSVINLSFPLHMQTEIELYYLESGSIEITIGTAVRQMAPGDLAIVFPNQIHAYRTADPASDSSVQGSHGIMILCPAETGGDFLSILLRHHPKHPFLCREQLHPDISYVLHALLQTPPDQPQLLPVIRAYIQLLLARALPCLELTKNKDNQPPGSTGQLIAYLSEHYMEPVSLDTLAGQLGVSKYRVSRIFSEKMHTSFSHYLNTLRVDNAKHLLHSSDLDILAISEICGYDTPRTFNREFKAICGCQPREYRIHSRRTSL